MRYRVGKINPAVCRVVGQFRHEPSPKEVHSYALLQNKDFEATEVEVRAKVKDLRAQCYYSDLLMLFDNFSANAVRDTLCYVPRCERFAGLVLEIQGIELAHRYAKIFRAYHLAVTGHTPQLLEYGLTPEAQYRLRNEVPERLSATPSFEAVYKALLGGDGRQASFAC